MVGAGVIGLTTGIRLLEAGADVRILAAELTADTTSAAATGMAGPVFHGPDPRTVGWELATTRELKTLDETAGVRMATGLGASTAAMGAAPPFADASALVRPATGDEVPTGFTSGLWMRVPLVDIPVYLEYLVGRFTANGGVIEQRRVESLALDAPIVVNCAGVGARRLAADPSVRPIKGQQVVVENPGLDGFFMAVTLEHEYASYHTFGRHVLLGGVTLEGSWDPAPSMEVGNRILERCVKLEPKFANARVLGHRAGLRPGRPKVRLEAETVGRNRIVHNYGHGGSGVLQSWGCAQETAELALAL
ncbi:FAD-dependent oxidoreductase [Fodinicola feengrottensis]|uniref:D-amino-acid oxidase n=1 Tax=Fodinicola feengrottensis TaxID=435914 RepID=A0ABN2GRZ0_9ACTN